MTQVGRPSFASIPADSLATDNRSTSVHRMGLRNVNIQERMQPGGFQQPNTAYTTDEKWQIIEDSQTKVVARYQAESAKLSNLEEAITKPLKITGSDGEEQVKSALFYIKNAREALDNWHKQNTENYKHWKKLKDENKLSDFEFGPARSDASNFLEKYEINYKIAYQILSGLRLLLTQNADGRAGHTQGKLGNRTLSNHITQRMVIDARKKLKPVPQKLPENSQENEDPWMETRRNLNPVLPGAQTGQDVRRIEALLVAQSIRKAINEHFKTGDGGSLPAGAAKEDCDDRIRYVQELINFLKEDTEIDSVKAVVEACLAISVHEALYLEKSTLLLLVNRNKCKAFNAHILENNNTAENDIRACIVNLVDEEDGSSRRSSQSSSQSKVSEYDARHSIAASVRENARVEVQRSESVGSDAKLTSRIDLPLQEGLSKEPNAGRGGKNKDGRSDDKSPQFGVTLEELEKAKGKLKSVPKELPENPREKGDYLMEAKKNLKPVPPGAQIIQKNNNSTENDTVEYIVNQGGEGDGSSQSSSQSKVSEYGARQSAAASVREKAHVEGQRSESVGSDHKIKSGIDLLEESDVSYIFYTREALSQTREARVNELLTQYEAAVKRLEKEFNVAKRSLEKEHQLYADAIQYPLELIGRADQKEQVDIFMKNLKERFEDLLALPMKKDTHFQETGLPESMEMINKPTQPDDDAASSVSSDSSDSSDSSGWEPFPN